MSCIFDTPRGKVELRELHSIEEMEEAERIQIRVWGGGTGAHPKEMLIPIQHEGGFLAGAFSSTQEMIGLVFSFPTRDPEIQHSQLLATLEEWRGLSIGTRLKWFQRDWCLEHGVRCVRWTVDPLRAANAELNIRHLGGVSATYYTDYYGRMQGIDAGAPTDRLLLEWFLESERVKSRRNEAPIDHGFPDAVIANPVENGMPQNIQLELNSEKILIRIPHNYIETSQNQPELAFQWRMQTRGLFTQYFARGYVIKEFTRIGGPAYLLEREGIHGN